MWLCQAAIGGACCMQLRAAAAVGTVVQEGPSCGESHGSTEGEGVARCSVCLLNAAEAPGRQHAGPPSVQTHFAAHSPGKTAVQLRQQREQLMKNVPAGTVVDDRMLALATSMQMVRVRGAWPSWPTVSLAAPPVRRQCRQCVNRVHVSQAMPSRPTSSSC
jgi:hypothetical protein